jgi:hypothetical protein
LGVVEVTKGGTAVASFFGLLSSLRENHSHQEEEKESRIEKLGKQNGVNSQVQ